MTLGHKTSLKTLSKRASSRIKEQQPPLISKAQSRLIRMSPLKVRRVLSQIQGCSYEEALILLRFLPYRACHPVAKVLKSAAANALNKYSIPSGFLNVEKAYVEKGPILKRIRPRAKGRMFPIKKRTSNIHIVLRSTFSRYETNNNNNTVSFVAIEIKN
jgi:large subunit ribosomal protein L22